MTWSVTNKTIPASVRSLFGGPSHPKLTRRRWALETVILRGALGSLSVIVMADAAIQQPGLFRYVARP